MKKYATILGLLVTTAALPACTNHYNTGPGSDSGYRGVTGSQFSENGYDENGYDDDHYYDRSNGYNSQAQYQNNNYQYANEGTSEHTSHWSGTHHSHHMDEKAVGMTNHLFAKADTNHDGYISRDEWNDHMSKMFDMTDTNHDGKLSRDEVMAMKSKEMEYAYSHTHDHDDNTSK